MTAREALREAQNRLLLELLVGYGGINDDWVTASDLGRAYDRATRTRALGRGDDAPEALSVVGVARRLAALARAGLCERRYGFTASYRVERVTAMVGTDGEVRAVYLDHAAAAAEGRDWPDCTVRPMAMSAVVRNCVRPLPIYAFTADETREVAQARAGLRAGVVA